MVQEIDARGQESGRDAEHQRDAESGRRAGQAGRDVGGQLARLDHRQRGLQDAGRRGKQRRVHPSEHMRNGLPGKEEQGDAGQVQQEPLAAPGAFPACMFPLEAFGHAGAGSLAVGLRDGGVGGIRLRGRRGRAAQRQ
ncbi:hypothetical protein D3C72_1999120 [compost metagenome]